EPLRRLAEDARPEPRLDRFVGIMVAARPLERIAAGDHLALQIAGLARDAAQLVEAVVERLDFLITHRPVLDRHVVRDRARAVALAKQAADAEVGRKVAPMQRAPV